MTNQIPESKVGYEKIGSWYISTVIPEEVRAIFRDNINGLLTGNPSENFVNGEHLLRYLAEDVGKKPHELTLEEKVRLLKDDALKNKSSHTPMTYVQHVIAGGSTNFVPPDPFVDLQSYLTGEQFDCYDKVKEWIEKKGKNQLAGGRIQGDNIVYETKLVGFPVPKNIGVNEEQYGELVKYHINGEYSVTITINYKTRELKIDPPPQMLKFWNIKV